MEPFNVTILASDHPFYKGVCYALTIPTPGGIYGIQAHHSSTIAGIVPGTLRYQTEEGKVLEAAVSGGIAKVENGEVLILVDTAERPEEIDIMRARRNAERGEGGPAAKAEHTGIPLARRPRPRHKPPESKAHREYIESGSPPGLPLFYCAASNSLTNLR